MREPLASKTTCPCGVEWRRVSRTCRVAGPHPQEGVGRTFSLRVFGVPHEGTFHGCLQGTSTTTLKVEELVAWETLLGRRGHAGVGDWLRCGQRTETPSKAEELRAR